jgi:hypothetical protein
MAIYHLTAKPISRASGRSATAASAYRSGERIPDARTGLIFDYGKKRGIDHTEISPRQCTSLGKRAPQAVERR